jgi:hypothetical protein
MQQTRPLLLEELALGQHTLCELSVAVVQKLAHHCAGFDDSCDLVIEQSDDAERLAMYQGIAPA